MCVGGKERVKEKNEQTLIEDEGCSLKCGSLCKWGCTKPLVTCIAQDKIFIYAIV